MAAASAVVLATATAVAAAVPETLPIPDDLRARIEQSVGVGQAIYLQDGMAARATDALTARLGSLREQGLGGYLTVQEAGPDGRPGPSWLTLFFTSESTPRLKYRVRVPAAGDQAPTVEPVSPPEAMPESTQVLIRARRTALSAAEPLQQPMNPVVLPAAVIGKAGILVYLIAGTTTPNVAVLGQHIRVVVSDDGGRVLELDRLSKSRMEMSTAEARSGGQKALAVTHLVTDYPLETHVFASLLHRLPIYVGTSRGIWCVDGATIWYMGTATAPASARPE